MNDRTEPEASSAEFTRIAGLVWDQVQDADFKGSDPYDGLNSRLLRPFLAKSRALRIGVIQGVKRSPVDLRKILLIPPGLNPKGLALLLSGACEWNNPNALGNLDPARCYLEDALLSSASLKSGAPAYPRRKHIENLGSLIAKSDAPVPDIIGWGYDFPWQARAFYQPAYFPTVVATSFVVDALEQNGSAAWPFLARSVASFVTKALHRHEDADGICFSYSPGDTTRVYNASLFGARILAQAATQVPEYRQHWTDLATQAVDWVVARQEFNGSWIYGEADHWQWIDNLHTGFNLETIWRVRQLTGNTAWDDALSSGLSYYRRKLFEPDGTPKYYSNTRWPLDPHSFAQGALTFIRLREFDSEAMDMAHRILTRGIEELWDEKRRGFRFQKHKGFQQRTIHLRWSQAWMFRALCAYLGSD